MIPSRPARVLASALLGLAAVACGDDGAPPPVVDTDVSDTTVAPDTVDTVDTVEVPDTVEDAAADTSVDTVTDTTFAVDTTTPLDCAAIPAGPFELTLLEGPVASEDLAFDDQGRVVGANDQAIFKSARGGPPQLFVAAFPFRAGLRYLPSGHLMVCDNERGELVRVDPDGVKHPVMTGLSYPNGLTVDLRGWVYLSEHDADLVWRVHPFTGEATVVTTRVEAPNGLAFSADFETLFISAFDGDPTIWALKLAPDGTPGRLAPFAEDVGSGWHDGLGVDACGNVYVTDYNEARIYRVASDGGAHRVIIDALEQPNAYLPNLQWGSGLGGFSETAIYVPDGWNKGVFEIEVGVPGDPPPPPAMTTPGSTPMGRPTLTLALAPALALIAFGCDADGGPADAADTAVQADTSADDTDTADVSEDTDAADTTGSTVVYGTPCQDAERVGHFQVGHWGFYAAVSGAVADGVVPLTVLQEVASDGDCRLLQKRSPFCDPPCTGSDLCDHDGRCVPYPTNLDAGAVTVSGLLAPVAMTPNAVKTYSETAVPLPLFDAAAPIDLAAAGVEVAAFSLSAFGVPELIAGSEVTELVRDRPLTLTWAAEPGAWRVRLSVNVDQHGTSPLSLVCDAEDAGSHTIAASLINQLIDGGVSGFATYELSRRTVDSVQVAPGCVELEVFSFATGKLAVVGHTPCTKQADCEAPQVCDLATNSCVDR